MLQCQSRHAALGGSTNRDGKMAETPGNSSIEAVLQAAPAPVQRIADKVPGVLLRYVQHPDGRDAVPSISPRCLDVWELPAEQIEQDAALLWGMVEAEDGPGVAASLQQSGQTLQPWRREWRITTPSGRRKWLEGLGWPQRQADGGTLWDTLIFDVTDRKLAEEALRLSQLQLQALLDNISSGVIVHGADSHIIDGNPAACRLVGLSIEQLRGKVAIDPYWCFLEEDGSVMPLERYPVLQVLARGSAVNKLVLGVRRPDLARPVWVQVDAYPRFDAQGQIDQIVVTFADITQLKLAEAGARRLNRSLRVLSSCNTGLALALDEAAYLQQVCAAVVAAGGFLLACVAFANPGDDMSVRIVARAGPAVDYLQGIQLSWDGDRATGRGPCGLALRSGRTEVSQDWRTSATVAPWRAEGLKRGFLSSIALPLMVAHQTVGVLALYAAEDDAFNPEEVPPLEELAHNVSVAIESQRARQQRDQAEGANRAKSDFLTNMSHEIRTPLNAIVGLNYLMRRDAVTPEQHARLDKVDAASQHLLSIITDVLDLAKIEAGRVQLETSTFHLSAVLDAVASMIADAARAKGLAVETDAHAMPLWLRGDPTRLRQALLNFAGNAVKFTARGHIVLRAQLMAVQGDDLLVRFSVEDTGIGIPAEYLPRLFQAFEQADASITRQYGGTGLGLAITRRLIELMGGDCGVDSQPGVGSTFWFNAHLLRGHGPLPLAQADSPASAEALLRKHHRGTRVLVAEDNEVNQEVLLAMLHGVGLSVDVAADGQQAVALARAGRYALVLMDMQMPVMDGLAATRAIRALPGWHAQPILALTANALDEDRLACEAAGMNDFIVKPTSALALYTTLLHWLDVAAASAFDDGRG